MGKSAVFVIGPAGSGKSTFCSTLIEHYQNQKRSVHLMNLDPAAEDFPVVTPSVDVRDLINLADVMEECSLGPNGGLIFCFEYLMERLEWLEDQLGDFGDDFLLVDCPGQIELYTHVPVMKDLLRTFQERFNYRVCTIYLMESQFMQDPSKYFSGVLCGLSSMIQLECPHINVLTKMDLVPNSLMSAGDSESNPLLNRFFEVDPAIWDDGEQQKRQMNEKTTVMPDKYNALSRALVNLIDEYSMMQFLPLNVKDEESIQAIAYQIEASLQIGEDEEPREQQDNNYEGDDE